VEIVDLSFDQPEVAHQAINDRYPSERPLTVSGDPVGFACRILNATAGELGSDRVRHTMNCRAHRPPLKLFLTSTVLRGGLDQSSRPLGERRMRRGDVVRYPSETDITLELTDVEIALLHIPLATVDRVARERSDVGHTGVRFYGTAPISRAMTRAWRGLTSFVHRELTAADSIVDSPLINAQLCDLVAATALSTFPNSTMDHSAPLSWNRATPGTLRRAMAFIDANAAEPITITDIAQAAEVTPRALQYGFALHHDTTPITYLRQVRLERAHRELELADGSGEATVAAIAKRWGFAKAGRFAAYYRQTYGVPPSRTLRS
jgi:AraC-like DNA-binding protein